MIPHDYYTFLQSKCASCSNCFDERNPKVNKLKFLTSENCTSFEELSTLQVLSYIYRIPNVQLAYNLTHSLTNVISETDYLTVLAALKEDNYLADQIANNICLDLCELCAPKLTQVYMSYKCFVRSLSADSLISKTTRDSNIQILNDEVVFPAQNCSVLKSEEVNIQNTESNHNSEDEFIKFSEERHCFENSSARKVEENQIFCGQQQHQGSALDDDNSNSFECNEEIINCDTIVSVSPKNIYCEICEIQFTSCSALEMHITQVHEKQPLSGKPRQEMSDIDTDEGCRSKAEIIKSPRYQCPKCTLRPYKNILCLRKHCRENHKLILPADEGSFQCTSDTSLDVQCLVCSASLKNIAGLKNHSRRAHRLPFVCSTCLMAFATKTLRNHNEREHREIEYGESREEFILP